MEKIFNYDRYVIIFFTGGACGNLMVRLFALNNDTWRNNLDYPWYKDLHHLTTIDRPVITSNGLLPITNSTVHAHYSQAYYDQDGKAHQLFRATGEELTDFSEEAIANAIELTKQQILDQKKDIFVEEINNNRSIIMVSHTLFGLLVLPNSKAIVIDISGVEFDAMRMRYQKCYREIQLENCNSISDYRQQHIDQSYHGPSYDVTKELGYAGNENRIYRLSLKHILNQDYEYFYNFCNSIGIKPTDKIDFDRLLSTFNNGQWRRPPPGTYSISIKNNS
jgi:hypothetical protein